MLRQTRQTDLALFVQNIKQRCTAKRGRSAVTPAGARLCDQVN